MLLTNCAYVGREAPVNAEELFIHQCCYWQCVKRGHACVVNRLTVLGEALRLEGEVFCQVATLVIPAQQVQVVIVHFLNIEFTVKSID